MGTNFKKPTSIFTHPPPPLTLDLYFTLSGPTVSPKESHLIAAKRILSYLKGIENYGLWYAYSELNLAGFTIGRLPDLDVVISNWVNKYVS